MELILSAFLGFITVTMLDRRWLDINHRKIERGFEALEHYHWGIGLIVVAIATVSLPFVSYCFLGAGMGLIYYEAKQEDYFAIQSSHFRSSTIIGIILTITAITIYFL